MAHRVKTKEQVNHPKHYQDPSGVECIDVIETMTCCISNSVKYLWRKDMKHDDASVDMNKAKFYLSREISRRENFSPFLKQLNLVDFSKTFIYKDRTEMIQLYISFNKHFDDDLSKIFLLLNEADYKLYNVDLLKTASKLLDNLIKKHNND